MRYARCLLLLLLSNSPLLVWSQSAKIIIPAGTPEDKELAAIGDEADVTKRIAFYEDFVKKYAGNKPAEAYGEWQLSQQYAAANDNAKALEVGDKALALYPTDLDIVVSQAGVAQNMKDYGKVIDYAARGSAIFHSIATQPKPSDVLDDEWKRRVTEKTTAAQPGYDFLESAAYNAIASEQDASKRMAYIEKFTPAFPKSKFEGQISQLALYSLQQLNQPQRLVAYGEKALAANPDSLPTLLMMANAYADDPAQAGKAVTYASKVIALVGPNAATEDKTKRSYAGLAHTSLGKAYLNQGKTVPAVTELKTAVSLLQDDPPDQQRALYYLCYAYAKGNHKADAVAALQKAIAIEGPYQAPAKEMLGKINAAGKK